MKVTYFSLSTSRKICSVHFETDLVPVKGVRKGNCPNCPRVCCIIVTDLSGRALGRQEKEDTRTSLSAPHGGQRPCCFRCDNTLNTKVKRCCETCSLLRTLSPFLKHLNQIPSRTVGSDCDHEVERDRGSVKMTAKTTHRFFPHGHTHTCRFCIKAAAHNVTCFLSIKAKHCIKQ